MIEIVFGKLGLVRLSALAFILVGCTSSPTLEERDTEALKQALVKEASLTGQRLYHYFDKLAIASLAVSNGPKPVGGGVYAAAPDDKGWLVTFGAIDPDGVYVLDAQVRIDDSGEIDALEPFDERREASTYHQTLAQAYQSVSADMQASAGDMNLETRHLRIAVLPTDQGPYHAFVLPARMSPRFSLHGDEFRYMVDRASGEVTDRIALHDRLIRLPQAVEESAGMEGAVAALMVPGMPAPTPIDVMHAMERGDHLVLGNGLGIFRIHPDGDIQELGAGDPMFDGMSEALESMRSP